MDFSRMNSNLVIKVKYGDTLRRFSVFVNGNGSLDLGMAGLTAKIHNLFKFSSDDDITLTYIDEDQDLITLVDDDDLRDAIRQRLNPLRINVQLKTISGGTFDARSSGLSTPVSSQQVHSNPLAHINSGLVDVLKSLPEPVGDVLSKLSFDLASKAVSSAPVFTELVERLAKLGVHPLIPVPQSQGNDSDSSVDNKVTEASEPEASEPVASKKYKKYNTPEEFFNAVKAAFPKKINLNAKSVDPAETSNSKGNGSCNVSSRGVGTSSIPTTTCVDLPKNSNEFGHSTTNSPVPMVMATNGHHGVLMPQKERDAQPNGKSVSIGPSVSSAPSDPLVKLNPNCSQASLPAVLDEPNSTSYSLCGDNRAQHESGIDTSYTPDPLMHPNPVCFDTIILPYDLKNVSAFVGGDNRKQFASGCRHSSASNHGLSSRNSAPISGMTRANSSYMVPSGEYVAEDPFRNRHSKNIGRIFHRGVRCDGCGVHPITGPRFKSKVKEDYDLCSICFSEMGNEVEYTRVDRPIPYQLPPIIPHYSQPPPSTLSHLMPGQGIKLPHLMPGQGFKLPRRRTLDSYFVQDVNIPDGTLIAPATPFTKIWRMRNNGSAVWPCGTQLVWIGGTQFTTTGSVSVQIPDDGCAVGKELDIAVDFTAPGLPGRYISYWTMVSPSGQKFGQRIWVLIQVDTSQVDTLIHDSLSQSTNVLNLNLPPNCSSDEPQSQIIDMNVEPADADDPECVHSNRNSESMKPMVDEDMMRDKEEHDFPIEDLNGSSSAPISSAAVPALASYPTIDSSVVPPPVLADAPTAYEEVDESNMVEETLLKELEEMGFKQIDLNKEILRLNEYNLEQSVDYLCGVSEWDPILEELQEMGFCDKDTNKMLLMKNGGSIKRVVMDLIAGERA